MILQAKIAKVDDVKKGTSDTTGKEWAQRRVLLSFNDEEGDEYISVGVDEDIWESLGLQEGQEATVRLKFYTRKQMSGYVTNIAKFINPQNAQAL
jgi:hypothetical protein